MEPQASLPEYSPSRIVGRWKDPVVQALLQSLDAKEYCVLHGWKTLPQGATSDVDLVVAEHDLEALERALRCDCDARIAQIIRYEGGCGFFFVAVREANGTPEFTEIDAATRYARDGRILLDGDELLAGRRKLNGMWVVRPESEFAYLLTKKICKRYLPDHQKQRLSDLHATLGERAARIAEDILGAESAANAMKCIAASRWSEFESRFDELHQALLRRASRRHRWNAMRYWTAEFQRAFWRWRNPTGLMLAVLGPDGAGKSTLIQSFEGKANPLFWWRPELCHFRPDLFGMNVDRGPVLDPHSKEPRNLFGSLLKLGYYAIDFFAGYVRKIRPQLIRSRLMIFDRYYEDILVDQRRYRYSGPIWLARLIGRFIPRPDLFLILDVPEETIRGRKQELSIDELRRQRVAYRELAAQLPNAVLLDGSERPGLVAQRAQHHIIDLMTVRYQQRRRTWFRDDRAETLQWLSRALSQDSERYLTLCSSRACDADSFRWLRLDDGRGYLLPADSNLVATAGLELYRPQRLKSRIAKAALRMAMRAGADRLLFSRVHVARSSSNGIKAGIFEHLRDVVGKPLEYAVSLGTPSPHRKPVIQMMDDKGKTLAFAKVGWSDPTRSLVRNEADTYRRLSQLKFSSFAHPRLLHADSWGRHFVSIQSAPASKATSAAQLSVDMCVRVAIELSIDRTIFQRFEESEYVKPLLDLARKSVAGNHEWIVREGTRSALACVGDRMMPFHPAHGDLAPWNASMVGNQLYLFDWEYSHPLAPAGWDLIHFFVQTRSLLAHRSPRQIIQEFGHFVDSIGGYLRRVQLDAPLLWPLLLLYVEERLAYYVLDCANSLEKIHLLTSLASLLIEQCGQMVRKVVSNLDKK